MRLSWLGQIALVAIAVSSCSGVPASSSLVPREPDVPDADRVGQQVCRVCHERQAREFEKTAHARADRSRSTGPAAECESCHGPGSRHVQSRGSKTEIGRFAPTLTSTDAPAGVQDSIVAYRRTSFFDNWQASEHCLSCHSSGRQRDWVGSRHDYAGVGCVACHNPMKAARFLLRQPEPQLCFGCHPEKRAQAAYPSHHPIQEGKLLCSSCHNQHGSTESRLLRADTVNELCSGCHPEKEGPFVFEHAPVTEGCPTCHEPHGTVSDNLLRQSEPFLCLSCHTGHQGPLVPLQNVVVVPEKRATFLTKCTQCHNTVHGTDLPSTTTKGAFTR